MNENPFKNPIGIIALVFSIVMIALEWNKESELLAIPKLKQTYLIDGELYKPVNVLGCIHLQTSRKSIHSWSLCRNKIHFNR